MSLAMTRAFGDYLFKSNKTLPEDQQAVIAIPEITRITLNDTIENADTIKKGIQADEQLIHKGPETSPFTFLIVACDGIWDVMSYKKATKFINERLLEQQDAIMQNKMPCYDLTSICAEIVKKCLYSRDNITIIIALLERGKTTPAVMGDA